MIQRLLGFARRQALETGPVDIAALIEGMRELIASSVGAGVDLRIMAPSTSRLALADPNQLELALLNLAVNARDAMPEGGVLTLTVDTATIAADDKVGAGPGDYVRISVIDTGVGMDADTLARAMDPFFSTKGVGKGTGLGLSMVHGLAAQLGGFFKLSSERGQGTRADLYLRAVDAAAVTAATPPAEAAAVETDEPLAILLVDDEDIVRASGADMLRELGHRVVEARGATEALGRLSGPNAFDILVTDYAMPTMNGVELARRAREISPGLGVLVITGYAGAHLDLPYPRLAKPFRQADLRRELCALRQAPVTAR